jgi:hypothetical protein
MLYVDVRVSATDTHAHAPCDCVHSACSFPAASPGSRSASRASHSAVTCPHHCAFLLRPPSSCPSPPSSSAPPLEGSGAEEAAAAAAKSRGLDLWVLIVTDECQ